MMLERLRSDPRVVGDYRYTMQEANLEIWGASISPIFIEYGIHGIQPIVFVKTVVLFGLPDD